ncbi:MAG: accessory gene regulator B family protein [Anaerocolumna sp.]
MIHKYSTKLAGRYADRGIIQREDVEIYSYGLEILISTIITITVLLISGFILHEVFETIILLAVYCPIRTFAGGYHTDSNLKCIATFIILYFLIILLYTNLIGTGIQHNYYLLIPVYISNIFILMLAPVETRLNPLPEKKKQGMKIKAFFYTFIYTGIITYIVVFNQIYSRFALLGSIAIIGVTALVIIGKLKYGNREVKVWIKKRT